MMARCLWMSVLHSSTYYARSARLITQRPRALQSCSFVSGLQGWYCCSGDSTYCTLLLQDDKWPSWANLIAMKPLLSRVRRGRVQPCHWVQIGLWQNGIYRLLTCRSTCTATVRARNRSAIAMPVCTGLMGMQIKQGPSRATAHNSRTHTFGTSQTYRSEPRTPTAIAAPERERHQHTSCSSTAAAKQ